MGLIKKENGVDLVTVVRSQVQWCILQWFSQWTASTCSFSAEKMPFSGT